MVVGFITQVYSASASGGSKAWVALAAAWLWCVCAAWQVALGGRSTWDWEVKSWGVARLVLWNSQLGRTWQDATAGVGALSQVTLVSLGSHLNTLTLSEGQSPVSR